MTKIKNKSGFTLIELLVVMSIIAVLMAILIPSLGAARQIAYKLFCINNLKQLGITVHSYTQEYKVYPVCVMNPDVDWEQFLGEPEIAKNKMLGVPVSLWPYHKEKSLYDCPMLKRKDAHISYCYDSRAGRERESTQSTYGSVKLLYNPPTSPDKPKKIIYDVLVPDRVKSPGKFIILYDLPLLEVIDANLYEDIDPDDADSYENETEAESQGYLWRHNGVSADGPHSRGFNILFADGRAKSYKKWNGAEMTRKPD